MIEFMYEIVACCFLGCIAVAIVGVLAAAFVVTIRDIKNGQL